MHFVVTGLNFRTAPIPVRERVSFGDNNLADGLARLLSRDGVIEGVILSTCNRVEIYALSASGNPNFGAGFLTDFHKLNFDLAPHMYALVDNEAVRHVCSVAAGLDSMVLGEPQIFGQLKDALSKAIVHKASGVMMEHLFGRIFGVVKKVRSKTKIGEFPVSISHTAVKLAQQTIPDLSAATVLVLGAGDMGQLTLRNLLTSGVTSVLVANRTFQKAVEIADLFRGTAIMFHELREYLPKVDILISSINAPEYVLRAADGGPGVCEREKRPLCVIDISVPRSIDPGIGALPGVRLYNIDDLQGLADQNAAERKREAAKAVAVIDERVANVLKQVIAADPDPAVSALRARSEQIRQTVIEETLKGAPMSLEQRALLESATKSMMERLLSESEQQIKEFASALGR